MRTFIILSSPSCCDKHSPRTFCRLICLHNSLFLKSYKSLLGIHGCADSAVVLCCYNHSGTIQITKDLVAPVFCSEHHLSPISPLEGGSAFLCLRQCSPISAHDSLESIFSSKSDTSRIYHIHVSRPRATCKCTLRKSRAATSALFS